MKKSMMFLAVGIFMLAGVASAQCCAHMAACPPPPPPAPAPGVTPCGAPCMAVALSPGFYMTTRPATPVLLTVPVAAPCPCPKAPCPCPKAPCPCAAPPVAEAPAPCAAPAPAEAPAPCAAPAPAEAPAPCAAPAPAEAPAPCAAAEAPAEAIAPCNAPPCGAPCAPVACHPAKLKRKMVCTRTVNITSRDVGGRPYTVTKRVSCRPRSIYYWD